MTESAGSPRRGRSWRGSNHRPSTPKSTTAASPGGGSATRTVWPEREAQLGLREAMERAVRHDDALRPQPAVDLREAQPSAGHATIVPDRRLRTVARLTPRRLSIKMNGRRLGRAAKNLAARQANTQAR